MPWQLLNLYQSSPNLQTTCRWWKAKSFDRGAFEDLKEAVNVTDRNHHPPPSGQLSAVVFLRTTSGAQSMYSLKTRVIFLCSCICVKVGLLK